VQHRVARVGRWTNLNGVTEFAPTVKQYGANANATWRWISERTPTTTMTVHRPLCELLRVRNSALFTAIQIAIREAERILPRTVATFSAGTAHDPTHTRTVEEIASLAFGRAFFDGLNDHELFLFILACHFHDLAMAGTEEDNESWEAKEQVRRDHHIRIGGILEERWKELGFEAKRDAEILGTICLGHRPVRDAAGVASWEDILETHVAGPGVVVRTRLLSAAIFAADELHIGGDRASARIQDFAQIQNRVSRIHWHRHRQVSGPAIVDGALRFDVRASTCESENDIRTEHLAKAFRAVRDFRIQIGKARIKCDIPTIVVQWDRAGLWRLLMLTHLADLTPRTVDEITEVLESAYARRRESMTVLAPLASELNDTPAERRTEAATAARHWITRNMLIGDGEGRFALSLADQSFAEFQRLLQEADEIDAMLLGFEKVEHWFALFRGAYGQRYASEKLVSKIAQRYHVVLDTNTGNSSVGNLITACPSACKVIESLNPFLSPLENQELVSLLAIAGTLADATRDPTVLLDAAVRRSLADTRASIDGLLSNKLRFLEELALVSALSLQEVEGLLVPSDAEIRETLGDGRSDEEKVTQVTFNQTILRGGACSSTYLPYLLLAQKKSGTQLNVVPTAASQLTVRVEGDAPADVKNRTDISMFSVGPGQPTRVFRDLPCEITVDDAASTVNLVAHGFTDERTPDCPILFRLNVPKPDEAGHKKGSMSIRMRPGLIRVRDAVTLLDADAMIARQGAKLVLTVMQGNDPIRMAFDPGQSFGFGFPISNECIAKLSTAQGNLPLPLLLSESEREQLSRVPVAELTAYIASLDQRDRCEKRIVTHCTLRRCDADGNVVRERCLEMFPGRIFNPPHVRYEPNAEPSTNSYVEWDAPSKVLSISFFVGDDPYVVEQKLTGWFTSLSGPFPIAYDKARPPSPMPRAVFAMEMHPHRENAWEVVIPVVLLVRPPSRHEELTGELLFWEHKGDEARAALIRERLSVLCPSESKETE
jgi:hypothetical protein